MLSGSMEPAFYRGDILFLYKGAKPIRAGEVLVFNDICGWDIPIVHRVIKVHEEAENGHIKASSSQLPGLPLGACMRKARGCSLCLLGTLPPGVG